MRRFTMFAAACFVLTLPSVSRAQTCLGSASFRAAPIHVGANVDFTKGSKSYGAELGFGMAQGLFGGAAVGKVDYDDLDQGSTAFGFLAGYTATIDQARKVELCPVASLAFFSGPDVDVGIAQLETSGRAYGLGASIGGILTSTASMDFVPFASAVYTNQTVKLKGSAVGQPVDESASDDYLGLTAGAGFIVNKVLTILPSISYPIGVEDADASFGVTLAFNFGSAQATSKLRR